MLKRILVAVAVLVVVAAAAFFVLAPGYVERALNPLRMPAEGWPVSNEAQALHDRLVIGDWHSDALCGTATSCAVPIAAIPTCRA
ncbi:hypothetical protein ACFSYD_15160 [Paracoccus aerius]